jgi:hypothetical protein
MHVAYMRIKKVVLEADTVYFVHLDRSVAREL